MLLAHRKCKQAVMRESVREGKEEKGVDQTALKTTRGKLEVERMPRNNLLLVDKCATSAFACVRTCVASVAAAF